MIRRLLASFIVCLCLSEAAASQSRAPAAAATQAAWDSAALAWDAGRYDSALLRLERLLTSPGGERFVEPAALLTGELFVTTELAPDGRSPRWSSDGRWVAFESVPDGPRAVTVVNVEGAPRKVILQGYGLAFSADGRRAAYFALEESEALARTRLELARAVAARDQAGVSRLRQEKSRLESSESRLVVRDLSTGAETETPVPGLLKSQLAPGFDTVLVFVAATAATPLRRDLYTARIGAGASPLAETAELESNPVFVPGGRLLLHAVDADRIAVRDVATGSIRMISGTAPALSADGSTLAFVTRTPNEYALTVVPLSGDTAIRVLRRGTAPLAAPALSPDGRRLVYQQMQREDWELFVRDVSGGGTERRLTREIQHDVLPRWLDNGRILAAIGEPRHRRSYLYDAETGRRTRLFHNNTVRTVSQEYEWSAGPDGNRLAIVADRDGNTISPERGVYLVDLTARVSASDVLARVRSSLAAERELRRNGERVFAPVARAVRAAVADVSVARISGYALDLFQLDSKHITRPGNRLAIEYLEERLRSFGYQPTLQWFEPRPGIRTANVVATLRGTAYPDAVYVVSSHFDSVEGGPGSDDNTSGTTALLEAARVLAGRPQPATIQFAFFTGEEAGLLGSREFVRRAVADSVRVAAALNNDMVGWANDHRLDNTIRYSNDWIRDIQHAAAFLFTSLITYDSRYYQSTDAAAYYDAWGDIVGGIGSYPILGNPHYHQPHDVYETINQRLVAEVSRTTVASVMLLASRPTLGR